MRARSPAVAKPEPVDPGTVFEAAREKFDEVSTRLGARETMELAHGDVERLLFSEGMEILRLLYQGHIHLRGIGEVAAARVTDGDGTVLTHCRLHPRQLGSLFGVVNADRLGYGGRGEHSVHPLDADLNLPNGLHSHEVQRRVALEVCKQSFDGTVEEVVATTGASVAKRQAEEIAAHAASDFEGFYTTRAVATGAEVSATGAIGVITSDGKGITMHPEDLRPQTRHAAEVAAAKTQSTFSLGKPKPSEFRRDRKRMAAVAAVYTIAPFIRTPEDIIGELAHVRAVGAKRPRPENKRVWARIDEGIDHVLGEACAEAERRDPARTKQWVGLVDGDEDQIAALERHGKQHGLNPTIIVDFLHVALYVWEAAWVFFERGTSDAEDWVRERLAEILRGRSSLVAAGIRRTATLRHLAPKQREAADKCADYLLKYRAHLRYDEYLAAGFPIGTGVIEGACRYLIQDRMGITGAVWRLVSADAVLKLRSIHASGDFDEYWKFHERSERRLNHDAGYAGGTAPEVVRPCLPTHRSRPAHLHVVP
jgi:hypothetical protein